MAKPVKGFSKQIAALPKYDWNSWFDGRVWRLKRGEDFAIHHSSFRVTAYSAATRHNKHVSVRVVDDSTIEIQARDRT